MATYAKGISERLQHTKISKGFCLICGEYGSLSVDHVPPKGSISITEIEQIHLTELMGIDPLSVRGVKSTNGSKFKTICRNCNSTHLGFNDQEVARICKESTLKIKEYMTHANNPLNHISVKANLLNFSRAMIGHILAATSVKECLIKPNESSYFDPLKKFVMGDNTAINGTHDIYYWFYPYRRHISAKFFVFRNDGNTCCQSILSFFPFAFLVTEKGKGIFPAGANKLTLEDKSLHLNLSLRNIQYFSFPFCDLNDGQFLLLSSQQAIVSRPT